MKKAPVGTGRMEKNETLRAISHPTEVRKMDDEEKLEAFIGAYKVQCSTLSNQMRDDLVEIPATIMNAARDYTQHGDINIFFLEVHAIIFALAFENQEDFEEMATWWMLRHDIFEDLINTT